MKVINLAKFLTTGFNYLSYAGQIISCRNIFEDNSMRYWILTEYGYIQLGYELNMAIEILKIDRIKEK